MTEIRVKKNVMISDCDGRKYKIEIEVYTDQYVPGKLFIHVLDSIEKNSLLPRMTLIKDSEKSGYQTEIDSGWMLDLLNWPKHKGIGSAVWREIESVFPQFIVIRFNGIVGYPPGVANPDRTEKLRIARLFWKKMGFEINSNDEIRKDYGPK